MDETKARRTSAGDVWLRPPRTQRGTPPLSRDRIVEEAVALLDEEGVDGLIMRRLAERLGTGSATLYWHVKTKDDVLDLALDAIFSDVAIPQGTGDDWRGNVTALITGWRAALLEHPWSAALLNRPMLGPNVLARSEFLYATLLAAGLTGPHLTAAAFGLSNYVVGSALMQATWHTGDEEGGQRSAQAYLQANTDLYPALAAHGPYTGDDQDSAFALGLTYLLDGIEANAVGTPRGTRTGTGAGNARSVPD
ncbi:TetR/AcrR family transcriptional regulator [Actinomadura sediminis]|uniref:TetR/AcrR family transcriptional regulator n=1 Tax=Actinomadura sediminis TaxID=1038904 RepID=A0ABW3EET7_9ACTN